MKELLGQALAVKKYRVQCRVGDLAAGQKNALVGGPFGSNLVSADYVASGIPVIRGQNMGPGRWVGGEFVYVSEEKAEALSANIARPRDLIFTQRGTLGQVAIVPQEPSDRYVVSQSQMKLTVDPSKADPLYLYYVFTTAEQQDYIRRNAIQTGVPHTNLAILRGTPLSLPPLTEQRRIAAILGALDDKVELNRRMNKTLEEMARTIFKSWFVDFDPVRAKAEGRQPTGMDAATAAIFPNSFQDSPMGKIPKGWKICRLSEITTKIGSGATPLGGSKVYVEKGIAFIRSQNVYDGDFRWEGLAHVTDEAAEELRSVSLESGDVLLNITGDSILRACVVDPRVLPARVNQHVVIIRAAAPMLPRYLHEYLVRSEMKNFLLGFDAGATRPAITKAQIVSIPVIEPPETILSRFEQLTGGIYAQREQHLAQNATLEELRDTLLPKLLSGELRVPNADQITRRAV